MIHFQSQNKHSEEITKARFCVVGVHGEPATHWYNDYP